MIDYTSEPTATFNGTIEQPQDVTDDVVVGTVNPATSILMDNTSALYQSAAMRCVGAVDDVITSATPLSSVAVVGWGRSVGPISVAAGTTIVATGVGAATALSLHTLASSAGVSAFAQDSTGSTVIGTGTNPGQTIWRSSNGGLAWSEIAYPSSSADASGVLIYWDRFSGDWYILRNRFSGNTLDTYRSTNNGISWTLQSSLSSFGPSSNMTLATDSTGVLWLNRTVGSAGTTYTSTNFGATWTLASPGTQIVNTVCEHRGNIYIAGWKTGPVPYLAIRQSGSWVEIPVTGPSDIKIFGRYMVTVGPLLVAHVAKGTASPDNYYFAASADGGQTWRYWYRGLNTESPVKWQARSPGGIHYPYASTTNTLTLSPLEMW